MSAVYPPRIRQSEWSTRSVNIDSGTTETSISYHRTRRGRDGRGSHVCPALPISSLPAGDLSWLSRGPAISAESLFGQTPALDTDEFGVSARGLFSVSCQPVSGDE